MPTKVLLSQRHVEGAGCRVLGPGRSAHCFADWPTDITLYNRPRAPSSASWSREAL